MIVHIIKFLHLVLILFIIGSVFISNYQVKKIAFTLVLFIFIQFITNYGRCGLTELEYMYTREHYKEGFLYRLVKPVITVPEKYFDMGFYWVHILWIIILGWQVNYFRD